MAWWVWRGGRGVVGVAWKVPAKQSGEPRHRYRITGMKLPKSLNIPVTCVQIDRPVMGRR